jgi:histidyl-tRNA synthetase
LIEEKGIDAKIADAIGEYAKLSGGSELIAKLKADDKLIANKDALEALEDLDLLLKYCSIFNLNEKVIIIINIINNFVSYVVYYIKIGFIRSQFGKRFRLLYRCYL